MGIYLNPNNTDFQRALNSEIYVDKSMLIEYTNKEFFTEQGFICVSRPRRFGKSMAANMLTAYYSKGCDSREMFSGLKIAKSESFEKHLNKYNVIHINMVDFLGRSKSIDDMLDYLSKRILHELKKEYSDVDCFDWNDLISVLAEIFVDKNVPFVFIIDEWDCIFRVHKNDTESQTTYLNFIRNLLKGKSYVALAYMTGILPIKKYGEHSALNMFDEYSMTNADPIQEFTGFTGTEVRQLCDKYNMPFEETKKWYDGYCLNDLSIYNPKSVVAAMMRKKFDNYWTSTETYEALKVYIEMNFDGLKDTIIKLLSGEKEIIDTTTFTNDMVTFSTKDDVLTLLIHLGYLTYDFYTHEVCIPNYEISQQFASTIKVIGWSELANALTQSSDLL